ncbi:MAG: glycosyltransferase [Salinivirgaceae bacterium]|nr:glycosyltransferase [Salinivirgaceae bacterium]
MEWSTQHLLYRFASMVTFISKSDYNYAKWLKNKTLIYNPLSYPISTTIHNNEKNIITIGPQKRWNAKGFDILIHAWAQIAPLHPDWKLQFVGTIDDNKISDMVKTLGLEKQVDFIGWTNEIDKILQTKSIYVLSSRREGFPCSLLEAMSQGCACLAFDCKTGPNEIITDGVSGILARNGDVDDLTAKLQLLIEDGPLRKRLGASATEEVRKFEKEKIMQQWDELIQLTVEQ